MLKSVFELGGQTFDTPGFLIEANPHKEEYGTIDIYHFESLKLSEVEDNRVYFDADGVSYWRGGQESKHWGEDYRKEEPYNRSSSAAYIPHRFSDLDIIPTSNESRFLSLTEKWKGAGSGGAVTGDYGAIGAVATTLEDVGEYLDVVLPHIGIPKDDMETIKANILGKFA